MTFGKGTCFDCGHPALGRMLRCVPCNTERMRLRNVRNTANYRKRHRVELAAMDRQRYFAEGPERRAYQKRYYKANKAKCTAATLRCYWRRKALRAPALRTPLLAYPYIAKPRDDHALILLVNSVVPHGMPGREDVCQSILLALLEGQITPEQVKAGGARQFTTAFRRDNYEQRGMALSLDVPMLSGRSWHDRALPILAEAA